jgi:predicted ATPase with chaperone activity
MTDQKQLENTEYFEYFDSMITNDARCTSEIKSRITMAKAALNKKKAVFTSKLDLKLRKKPVKCYIWSIALYGAETRTLCKVHQKYLDSFAMRYWRRIEKISWTDCVSMKKYYKASRKKGISYKQLKEGRLTGLLTSCV